MKKMCECQKEIESLLSKYNTRNTLDFVLAKYLENCLKSFNDVITLKERIDNEKLIDEIEEENGGAFIISNQSELESNELESNEYESNSVTVFEKSDVEVNIFDADEMIEEVGDSELEFNDSEVSDDDFWN